MKAVVQLFSNEITKKNVAKRSTQIEKRPKRRKSSVGKKKKVFYESENRRNGVTSKKMIIVKVGKGGEHPNCPESKLGV